MHRALSGVNKAFFDSKSKHHKHKENRIFCGFLLFIRHLTPNKPHHSLYLYTASGIPNQGKTLLGFGLSVLHYFFHSQREPFYSSFSFYCVIENVFFTTLSLKLISSFTSTSRSVVVSFNT